MTTEIESLLAEAPWLARLARSFTGSASEGEDIVQENHAALRSPPNADRQVRPGLGTVALNLVRMLTFDRADLELVRSLQTLRGCAAGAVDRACADQ